jgi:hypothetical protein
MFRYSIFSAHRYLKAYLADVSVATVITRPNSRKESPAVPGRYEAEGKSRRPKRAAAYAPRSNMPNPIGWKSSTPELAGNTIQTLSLGATAGPL